jgi:NADH dehydrogenase
MDRQGYNIETGSRVAVIGGGPAGSFFALYLLRYAEEKNILPDITIYQGAIDEPGPLGCKGCAGILSLSLLRNLSELGLAIPESIIQSKIDHYAVHTPYASISISNPEKDQQIVSVYRGAGPRMSDYDEPVSFDGWLLREAQKRGAKVVNQTVNRIYLDPEVKVEVAGKKLSYDLIVLATGVNAKTVPIDRLDYIPPRTQPMAQDELHADAAEIESCLGNVAHAFLIPHTGLIFGTLVPKGEFVTVSVLSQGKRSMSVSEFLEYDIVKDLLPKHYQRACGCLPQAATGCARNYYTDRLVTVGDAVVSRLYKDGIGSSLLTAREAAHTVVYHGLSREDFARHYEPFCNSIDRDNRWGRLLFSLNNKIKNSRTFTMAQSRLIGDEQSERGAVQPFTKAVWGMFTGSYSYRSIYSMVTRPISLAKFLSALSWEFLRGSFVRKAVTARSIHVGKRKVLILGSGFGGTYALGHLVPSLNKNENVETTVISNENFFLFSPLLHEVAMGRIETRHIAYPIRRLHWRDRFDFIQANVESIDLEKRSVLTTAGTLDFDYLVLALGSISDMPKMETGEGIVFTLKTLHDSMLIRNHIIETFERASIDKDAERQKQLLTFVVSGAGYVGIQLVTELRDFTYRHLKRFYRTIDAADIKVILVEIEPQILAGLHPKLSAYVRKQLGHMGIEVRLKSRITRVLDGYVEINGDEIVPTNTLIWAAGIVANPQIAKLEVEKGSLGRVLVNEYLEVPEAPGVYAVGDCAYYQDPRTGQPIPPRAHTAVRQAKVAAHNILAEIRGRDKKPYRYSQNAEMVSLGTSKAILRFRGLRIYGPAARFVWLIAYVLLVTGTYNRIRIVIDWLLSFIFGRDTTLLRLIRG